MLFPPKRAILHIPAFCNTVWSSLIVLHHITFWSAFHMVMNFHSHLFLAFAQSKNPQNNPLYLNTLRRLYSFLKTVWKMILFRSFISIPHCSYTKPEPGINDTSTLGKGGLEHWPEGHACRFQVLGHSSICSVNLWSGVNCVHCTPSISKHETRFFIPGG